MSAISRRGILQTITAGSVAFSVAGCLGSESNNPELETRTVTIKDSNTKEELGVVEASVADTPETRFTGLSNHESLEEGQGMLFLFEDTSRHTFVMRDMNFPIDIIYIDSDQTITTIHNAEAPTNFESGTEEKHQYPGTGKYVLETPHLWTSNHNISTGDTVKFS